MVLGLRKIVTYISHKTNSINPQRMALLKKVNAGIASDYCKQRACDMFAKAGICKNLKTNFNNEKKFSILRDYIFKYGKKEPELAGELYCSQYLSNIDKPMAKILHKIYKRFGTKVFIMDEARIIDANFIYKELEAYAKASKGKAVFPNAIEITTLKDFRCKKFEAGGFAYYGSNNISINGTQNLQWALRHELMHLNDNLVGLIPNDVIVKLMKLLPKENAIFKQFSKAGISEGHIPYAYTNADEFIAVASEGNVSEYSKQFKMLLRAFGMPKWSFKLQENPIKAKEELKTLKRLNKIMATTPTVKGEAIKLSA